MNENFLGTEPVGRLLRRLALPTVTAQLINMLYNMVDRIYIGHIPEIGRLALTGVGVCMSLIMIVSAFAALVSCGGAPRASIFMGQGRDDQAELVLGNCFALQVLVSLVLTAVLLLWNRDFLLAFGASENTIGYATDYMNTYAAGTLFVQLTLGMNAFITAQGFTKTSMLSVVIGALCNIVLDPILIFGLGMGVKGAALATILSQAVSCVWVVSFLAGKKTRLRLRAGCFRIRPQVILPCLALGTAGFVMQASESVINICFNSSLLKYGDDIAVGAMTILSSVLMLAMLPLQGLAQGAQPIISFNRGARNAKRVRDAFWLLLKACTTYAVLLWGLVMLFPQFFVRIFNSEAALVDYAARALRIYFGAALIFGPQIACQMTFTALGNAKSAASAAIVRKFVLLLPLIYLLPAVLPIDKATAVYLAEPIADFLAVCFTVTLFSFQFRKVLRQMEAPEEA